MNNANRVRPRFLRALELVGKRWSGAVIGALMDGPRRFSEVRNAVPGLHDRLLSERLKELRAERLIRRRVRAGVPVRIEYALTSKGHDLERVVSEMQRWADRWQRRRR